MRTTKEPKSSAGISWRWPLAAVALIVFSVGVALVGLNFLGEHKKQSPRAACLSNLHQINIYLDMYTRDCGGNYPDSFESLITYSASPLVFICPSSKDTPAKGATTQAMVSDFQAGGHCSYIYLGRGLTKATVPRDTVLICEAIGDHDDAVNVLFADGRCYAVKRNEAIQILNQATTGVSPVCWPATRPAK